MDQKFLFLQIDQTCVQFCKKVSIILKQLNKIIVDFFVITFGQYTEEIIWCVSSSKSSDKMPVFTCTSTIVNFCDNFLGDNGLISHELLQLASNIIGAVNGSCFLAFLFSNRNFYTLRYFSLPLKGNLMYFKNVFFRRSFPKFCVFYFMGK